jgi:hypothetical protein
LHALAGTYGGARYPSNFLCLVLKLLQIQPADEVITEYILQEDSKYLRILGAFYLRLTSKPDKVCGVSKHWPPLHAPLLVLTVVLVTTAPHGSKSVGIIVKSLLKR